MSKIWKWGVAGDYDFDPLDLYSSLGDDVQGRRALREVEITQGRYAMLGITYFAMWEYFTKTPIVQHNLLFTPNLFVPAAAIGYFVWSQFYQISDLREYPIKIEYTTGGEELQRNLMRTVDGMKKDAEPVAKAVSTAAGKARELGEKAIKTIQEAQEEN